MSRVDKVIVVGLDGLEPTIVEALLNAGELPHLARLRALGGHGKLATTSPAQTPVAWSTFATGTNPGGHGIFDFIGRDPATYRPDVALNRYEQPNAFLPPRAVNLRRGVPVWSRLTAAGIRSAVLRCPCTFPPDAPKGRLLSGMGVPDLRGGFGTGTYYTTDPAAEPGEGEQVVTLDRGGPGPVEAHVIGPRNPRDRSDARAAITIEPDGDGGVRIRSGGSPAVLPLVPGRWSGWLRLKFKVGLLQSVRGMVRFLLLERSADRLALYASPVNFDPDTPLFPISHPDLYAGDLLRAIGPYHTTGMVEDHAALVNERIDEAAFLAQCDDAWREREAMFRHELDRLDSGLLYCLFDTTDRVQHLFWRFREPDHPANAGRPPAPEFAAAIPDAYRRGDAMVGHALEAADDRTLVVALSDHGFGSFRRGVNLNTWLYEHGYLFLRDGARPEDRGGVPLRLVDWGRTRAYALGLTGLYLNMQGREGEGIVPASEAEALKDELCRGLTGLADPASGAVAVNAALPRERVFSGPFVAEAPDLVVHYGAGYRASWDGSLGGLGPDAFEDNTRKWAGDHIIDPALVPGVVFLNRPCRLEGAGLVDLAPTILAALGAPADAPEFEGRDLLI